MLGGLLKSPILLATATLLSVALLCIGAFGLAFWNQRNCKMQLTGVYLGFSVHTSRRGRRSYYPVFKYYFQGTWYQSRAYENYSLKKINERFKQGQAYPIWISEKKPDAFITRRNMDAKNIIVLLVGLFMLCLYGGAVLVLLVIKFAPQLGLNI